MLTGKNTLLRAKNFGRFRSRAVIELLFIEYTKRTQSDYSITFSAGHYHGLGVSFLCPWFLFEISLFPLIVYTHSYYIGKQND